MLAVCSVYAFNQTTKVNEWMKMFLRDEWSSIRKLRRKNVYIVRS